jgi:hypothetical protein
MGIGSNVFSQATRAARDAHAPTIPVANSCGVVRTSRQLL